MDPMDSGDEFEETPSYKGVPAVIILINVYDPAQNGTAKRAHVATCRLIRQHLRHSSTHYTGVSLYGTEETNTTSFGIQNIIDVFPLSLPTLDDYNKLRDIDISTIKQAKELTLSDALSHCSKMFAQFKKQLSSKTIIILSDLLHSPIKSDQEPTYIRVKDLVDSNINISVIRISEIDSDINIFYKNFLKEANKGNDINIPQPIWDEQEIEQLMTIQSHRHLPVANLSFEIGEGLSIGVGVYRLLKSSGYDKPKTCSLHRDTNAVLTSTNEMMKVIPGTAMDVDEEEAQESKNVPLLKSELLYYKIFGNENIEFTDNEMKSLKNPFGPPMLKLLGFKPASLMCKEKWFFKKGYFLFPNEGIIEGSTLAFKAMHQACAELKKVAICIFNSRVNSRPFIVALSPCTNPLGLDIEIGFDLIVIPFIENVKDIPIIEDDENVTVSEDHKDVMSDVLNSLKFDYVPNMFENPSLRAQYLAIEAKALDAELQETFEDTTICKEGKFKNIQDDLFNELFGPFGVAVKRPATSKETNANKKPKGDIDEQLLETRLQQKKVDDYKVPELKDILKMKSIPKLPALTGKTKKELVELVYKHFK